MMGEILELSNDFMSRVAVRVEAELVLVAPTDRGRLVPSIKVRPTSEGIIITMAEQGKWVEFGTPPHVIRAKPGKFLVIPKAGGRLAKRGGKWKTEFKFGGKKHIDDVIFVKKVNHPGTRPNPFIRNTLQTKLAKIVQEELLR